MLALALGGPRMAAAQQTLAVDCATQNINSTLSSFTNRNGPTNVLNVTGTCNQFVNITAFNGLTVQGNPSATLRWNVTLTNAENIKFKSLILDFDQNVSQGQFGSLALVGSSVSLDGVTIQNSKFNSGVSMDRSSYLSFTGAASTITNNGANGIDVNGGRADVANVTITIRSGVRIDGGFLDTNAESNNGASVHVHHKWRRRVRAQFG
jgi:hypothetical protein